MTDFAGQLFPLGPGRVTPEGRSTNITGAVAITALSASLTKQLLGASAGTPQPAISVESQAFAGQVTELFGGRLFERVLVIPRTIDLAFVLTATEFPVEVWNTGRDIQQVLESITVTGVGGIIITDPFGEPLLYASQDSRIYQATMPQAGSPTINLDVVFAFLSGIGGTDMAVTGSRVTVFSVAPNWDEGMAESIEYLTNVLKAYSDNEQRRGLRAFPRRGLRFRALTLNARNAAGLEALIWGSQDKVYGVPWWPDATPMTADTAAGAFFIPCDTTDRQFAAGGLCCIWQDEYTFEAFSVESVVSNGVNVQSPTQLNWVGTPATLVMPLFAARLPDSVEIKRSSSEIDQLDVQFVGEAQQVAPAPASSPTQYKSIDVLEIAPNWETVLNRIYKRSIVTIDPKVGPITVIDKGGSAVVSQQFPWWLGSHADVTAFRAFMLRRFGQLNSFWIPTWDQDLVLAVDVAATDPSIVIQSEFYARFFFQNPARRFVAFIPVDGSGKVYREITGATDNGNGTETLVLDSTTGKAFAAAQTMVSFLTLARLATDAVEIDWLNNDLARASLTLQELPRELPS